MHGTLTSLTWWCVCTPTPDTKVWFLSGGLQFLEVILFVFLWWGGAEGYFSRHLTKTKKESPVKTYPRLYIS